MEASLWLDPPGAFTLYVHTESPEVNQLQFRFLYPGNESQGGFCSCVSVVIICDSLYLPASLVGGSVVCCDLTTLTNLRRVVDFFSVCPAFYLLEQNSNVQTSCMPDGKPEVL